MPNVFDSAERIPLPPDLKCPSCNSEFTNQLALRGHAAKLHGIKFEQKGRKPTDKVAIQKLRDNRPDPLLTEKLQPWQILAITQHVLYGVPLGAVVDEIRDGRGKGDINKVARSPAGTALQDRIREIAEDPTAIVKMLLDSQKVNMTAAWFAAFQWAVEAKDHNAVHRMVKEVGLQDMLQQPQKQGVIGNITVVIAGGVGLDTPEVRVTHSELPAGLPADALEGDFVIEGDVLERADD